MYCLHFVVPIFGFSSPTYFGTETVPSTVVAQVNILNEISVDSPMIVQCSVTVSGNDTASATAGELLLLLLLLLHAAIAIIVAIVT